jgi:hypothetical protein
VQSELAAIRATLTFILRILQRMDPALQTKLDALSAEVATNTTVEGSTKTLIQGLSAQLTAALAAASSAGATPDQLAELTTLQTTLAANDADLAAAVAANTQPPAPAPADPQPAA